MKKLLSLIILSMLVCFSAEAKERVYTRKEVKKCGENLFCDLEENLLTGIVNGYYIDGTLMYETSYRDGEKDGVEKWYYSEGNLYWKTPFKNGEIDGVEKEYREDGSLKTKTYYENGKIIKEIIH